MGSVSIDVRHRCIYRSGGTVIHWASRDTVCLKQFALEALKRLSKFLLAMTPQALAKAKVAMELIEVEENAQDEVSDS